MLTRPSEHSCFILKSDYKRLSNYENFFNSLSFFTDHILRAAAGSMTERGGELGTYHPLWTSDGAIAQVTFLRLHDSEKRSGVHLPRFFFTLNLSYPIAKTNV